MIARVEEVEGLGLALFERRLPVLQDKRCARGRIADLVVGHHHVPQHSSGSRIQRD